jgi:hypothetical protein
MKRLELAAAIAAIASLSLASIEECVESRRGVMATHKPKFKSRDCKRKLKRSKKGTRRG